MRLEELNGKRIFDVDLGLDDFYDDLAICRIAIAQRVFDRANSEEFKHYFYDLGTDEEIASHVAVWLTINDYYRISDVEGFAGLDDEEDAVKILTYPEIGWQGKAKEINPNTLPWEK